MNLPDWINSLFRAPKLTRPRMVLALAVAVAADGLQFTLGPLGWAFADQVIDFLAMALVSWIIGFHILLLPTFVVEFLPVLDELPTWTACTAAVIALRKREQQNLPPPPPPPPDKQDIPDPQQQPDPTPSKEPAPSQNLGLDTEGGAGGDAFGLVGNKGGRDITATGGSAFAWYAGLLKDQIQSLLNGDEHVRSGQFRVSLRVWVAEDGSVRRVEIMHGSGSADRDRAIETDLQQLKRLSQAPPAGMPDVISLEVRAQG